MINLVTMFRYNSTDQKDDHCHAVDLDKDFEESLS